MSARFVSRPVLAPIVGALALATASAQQYPLSQEGGPPQLVEDRLLTAGVNGDGFGDSVSVFGNRAVVGAPEQNGREGAAYVYERVDASSPWTLKWTLAADDYAPVSPPTGFGDAVAIADDVIVIGAPDENLNEGAAYVYSFATGLPVQRLSGFGSGPARFFGLDVAVGGTAFVKRIVVGAPGTNTSGGTGAGAAYVFEPSGGSYAGIAELVPSDATTDDFFGGSVDIDGDLVVVGAPFNDHPVGGVDYGSAYVFQRQISVTPPTVQWPEQAILLPGRIGGAVLCSPGSPTYGFDVAIDGPWVAVGAPRMEIAYSRLSGRTCQTGAVYLFAQTGPAFPPAGPWTPQGRLLPSDLFIGDALSTAGTNFGFSLDLEDDLLVIGAFGRLTSPLSTSPVTNQGAAYVYRRNAQLPGNGWAEERQLVERDTVEAPIPSEGHRLGWSVSASDRTVLVGGPYGNPGAGVALSFELEPDLETLSSSPAWLSASVGGSITLRLDAGPAYANADYVLYASDRLLPFGFGPLRLDPAAGAFCCVGGFCFEFNLQGIVRGTLNGNGKRQVTLTPTGAVGDTLYYGFIAGSTMPGVGTCAGLTVFDPFAPGNLYSDETAVSIVP